MVEYCNVSYSESREMPVAIRKWWIRRKSQEIENKKMQNKER